jgi:hypothetical protein
MEESVSESINEPPQAPTTKSKTNSTAASAAAKRSKKMRQQQKLARLVAKTFGPDSIDLFKNTMTATASTSNAEACVKTNVSSSSDHCKTTKKLNKKFNLLQKKITSLIESNQLEPLVFSANNAVPIAHTKLQHEEDDEISEVL